MRASSMNHPAPVNTAAISSFLKGLLDSQLPTSSKSWLWGKLDNIAQDPTAKSLYILFGMSPRFITKDALVLTPADIKQAQTICQGWQMHGWTTLQTARVLSVLSFPYKDPNHFQEIMEQLFVTGEVQELVALYSALPLYPFPESLKLRAAEGIRTNMTVVFDAVALRNPYAHDYLPQDAWNQMILKALFMERPIYEIWGVDERSNASLVKMISDFAHERWAAGRTTSPEMWRPVKTYASKEILEDMRKLLIMDDHLQQVAAVLMGRDINTAESADLLQDFSQVVAQVDQQNWDWDTLGHHYWRLKDLPPN